MFDENETTQKPANFTIGQNLSDYSVTELEKLIAVLTGEIDRVKADIVNKNQSKSDAQSIFKN